jgi:transcription termination factor NusB
MVAIAFVNMDADTFVNGLLDEIKKYQAAHRRA